MIRRLTPASSKWVAYECLQRVHMRALREASPEDGAAERTLQAAAGDGPAVVGAGCAPGRGGSVRETSTRASDASANTPAAPGGSGRAAARSGPVCLCRGRAPPSAHYRHQRPAGARLRATGGRRRRSSSDTRGRPASARPRARGAPRPDSTPRAACARGPAARTGASSTRDGASVRRRIESRTTRSSPWRARPSCSLARYRKYWRRSSSVSWSGLR